MLQKAVALTLLIGVVVDGRRLFRHYTVGAPKDVDDSTLPPEEWFEQQLDHFNPSDARTWQQRFYTNATFHREGGPVFLMIGGEGEASAKWMVKGQWIVAAEKFGALCFQVEHRYYGKSHPLEDMSTKNLVYLNSEQALADLAYFIQEQNIRLNLHNSKWVAFGGSYPGNLAAWVRLKYPHLIHASVASSAPVFAKVDFPEYLEVVTDALKYYNPTCLRNVRAAVSQLEVMLKQKPATVETLFKLCTPVDLKNAKDVASLYENLAGNFEDTVQYNHDNRHWEGSGGTNVTVEMLCDMMTGNTADYPIKQFASVNSYMLKMANKTCLDYSYNKAIQDMLATDWNSSAAEGGRQWTFQTCIEFGYFQSSSWKYQPFGKHFPVKYFIQQCRDIFGSKYDGTFVEQAVNWTNSVYGGRNLNVTRVVFPNGSIDPWHALGITSDLNPDAPAIFIEGTAHCADMYPSTPDDLPQLIEAREKIMCLLEEWLNLE